MVRLLSIAGLTKPMTTNGIEVEGQLLLRRREENNSHRIVSVTETGKLSFENSIPLFGHEIEFYHDIDRRDRDRERGRDRERDRLPIGGAYSRPPPPPLGATNYNPHVDRDRDRDRERWMGVPRDERYASERFVTIEIELHSMAYSDY